MDSSLKTASAIIATLAITACGGGGASSPTSSMASSPPPVINQSIGGIWQGTNTVNGITVKGMVLASEDGKFYSAGLNESNNCADVGFGTATVNGSTFSANISAGVVLWTTGTNIQTDCAFSDGSTWGTGTVSGTVSQGQSLTTTGTTFTTSKGTVIQGPGGTLTFNSLYNEPSSLSKLAGNWTGVTGVVTTINSDGTFFAQDPTTGCVVNGSYSIIDPNHNLYSGSATYANCTGTAAVLNGETASGLVTLNDTVSPNELEGGASVTLSNGEVLVAVATGTRNGTAATYTIGGTIAGLSATGLTLEDNGADSLAIESGATSFTFATALTAGASYAVTIEAQPTGQTCAVANSTGTVESATITSVAISCTTNATPTYTISGSITGLTGAGLVLQDNSGNNLSLAAGATSFTFSTPLASGAAYAVSVLTQPASPTQTCAVTNATGTIGSTNVADVAVSCTTNTYTVGGSIAGLTGTGLVLQDNGGNNQAEAARTASFTFKTALPSGTAYAVTVLTQPANPAQTCTVSSGTGTVGSSNATSVAVSCATNTYTVGGTVSGLTGAGLVLQDNSGDNLDIAAGAGFTFATALASGATYAVTIQAQPDGQTCTITNGTGTVANANINNVAVTCSASMPPAGTFSPYVGLWAGKTEGLAPGYPGMIVDGKGVYWAEIINWVSGPSAWNSWLTGTLSASVSTASQGYAYSAEEWHGGDTLAISNASVSAGVLTLIGTLTGNCNLVAVLNNFLNCDPISSDPVEQWPWTDSFTQESPTAPVPVSALAGSYTTLVGGTLTINTDGTFILLDPGSAGPGALQSTYETSDCSFAGTITITDPSVNVYSVTAVTGELSDNGCSYPGQTASGVFTLLPDGQLAGGLGSEYEMAEMDTCGPPGGFGACGD